MLIFANRVESKIMQRFVRGETNADGSVSSCDFIPGTGAPAYLTDKTIVGDRPPESYDGLKVTGSIGDAWLIETLFMLAGYVLVVASSGASSERNTIGFRAHKNLAYPGLRTLPGNQQAYPLVGAFYSRG